MEQNETDTGDRVKRAFCENTREMSHFARGWEGAILEISDRLGIR